MVPLRKHRGAYYKNILQKNILAEEHITRAINKVTENLFLNDIFKIIKCLEEQLYQILEKLKSVIMDI